MLGHMIWIARCITHSCLVFQRINWDFVCSILLPKSTLLRPKVRLILLGCVLRRYSTFSNSTCAVVQQSYVRGIWNFVHIKFSIALVNGAVGKPIILMDIQSWGCWLDHRGGLKMFIKIQEIVHI